MRRLYPSSGRNLSPRSKIPRYHPIPLVEYATRFEPSHPCRYKHNTDLVGSAELHIDVKVLLAKLLYQWREEGAEHRRCADFRPRLLRVLLGAERAKFPEVDHELRIALIGSRFGHGDFAHGDADRLETCCDECFVVLGAVLDLIPRKLVIYQERVRVDVLDNDLITCQGIRALISGKHFLPGLPREQSLQT